MFFDILEVAMESVSSVDNVSNDFNNSDLVVPSRYDCPNLDPENDQIVKKW